jgi:hypothetical protein
MRLIAVAALAEHDVRESDQAPSEEVATALAFSLSQLGISNSAAESDATRLLQRASP